MLRFRIIPATIVVASLMLAVKVVDVIHGTETLSDALFISSVDAETPAPTPNAPSAAPAASQPASTPAASSTDTKSSSTDSKSSDAKTPGAGDVKKDAESANMSDKDKNPNVSDSPGQTVDRHYSAVEVELLENLANRRDELNQWAQNIQVKEEMLNATEKRIDEKVQQIEGMKQEVSQLLAQYNEKEDAKIHSLVKIYENMKPKDAARIFNETEMPILLLVIDKMSEKKAAPILPEMDPRKARDITVQLAQERRINSTKLNPIAAATAPAPAAPAPKTAQP